MIVLVRKKYMLSAVAAAALCAALLCLPRSAVVAVSGQLSPQRMVILDAGHGGADGGAVSDSGVTESGLNLAITRRLAGVLTFCGRTVLLTRAGEASLCDDPAADLRRQKVSDTQNRVALINSYPDARLISIHQNTLPGHPGVRGAQAFHNGKGTADTLAQYVQQALNIAVNEREKTASRISDSIYLMKHVTCPAVLVECGFLSSPEETALLQEQDYQLTIAAAIAAGFCQYCTNEGWK